MTSRLINAKNAGKYPIEADFVKEGSNSLFLTLVVTFSLLSEALMTQKNDVELPQQALNRVKPLKHAKYKKGPHSGYFWREPPLFFNPKVGFLTSS